MRTEELDYPLPERLIATRPAEPRDACRLMVVSRSDRGLLEHARFADLPRWLTPRDVLIFNTSGVLPARLVGARKDTGGAVEGLFLREDAEGWRILLKSNSKLRPGQVVALGTPPLSAEIELVARDGDGWIARLAGEGDPMPAVSVLERVGSTPLPPYILRQRRVAHEAIDDDHDRLWYQTVYARSDESGSVAAPTAGLHFTPDLLARIASMGVARADVRLDVGVGTFKPIETEHLEDHPMHAEWVRVPGEAIDAIEKARGAGGRAIAVGTTSVRALESVPAGHAGDWEDWTRLMIAPGHSFARVDGLVTNFHLPRSTLLAMVGALLGPGGVERLKSLYAVAVAEGYRFYSYGDAMLILP